MSLGSKLNSRQKFTRGIPAARRYPSTVMMSSKRDWNFDPLGMNGKPMNPYLSNNPNVWMPDPKSLINQYVEKLGLKQHNVQTRIENFKNQQQNLKFDSLVKNPFDDINAIVLNEFIDLANQKDMRNMDYRDVKNVYMTLQNKNIDKQSMKAFEILSFQPDKQTKQEEEIDDIEFLLGCFEGMTDFKKELIIEQYKVENDKLLHPSLEFFDTVSELQF